MDQYNLALDYGRTQFDVRHRGFFGGTILLPYAISAAPFVTISSGSPFNITDGNQFNGDRIFNARPAFAPPVLHARLQQTRPAFTARPMETSTYNQNRAKRSFR